MRDRRDLLTLGLTGALIFCVGLLLGPHLTFLPAVKAQDSGSGTGNLGPESPVPDGTAIDPTLPREVAPARPVLSRTYAPQASDSNSNNRFVAITCPVGSGESVLFVLDAKHDQLLTYRFLRNKGLAFLAARKIDYDLKINEWNDESQFSRDEMKRMHDKHRARVAAEAAKSKKSG